MVLAFGWLLSSCSVTRMLPAGPVLSAAKRVAQFGEERASGVQYGEAASGAAPRIPFLVFGVTYDLDLVLVSKHPEWEMHEYARIATPAGPRWLAKDSRASNGDQLLVADIDELDAWLPEIPLARKRAPLSVEDRSSDSMLDISISYQNHDGEDVEVHYVGPPPTTEQSRRNGSTMGHSRRQVLAVLDLSHQDFAREATISFNGEVSPVTRVAGVVPMRLALQQTQGGIAQADFSQRRDDGSVITEHRMPSGARVEQAWELTEREGWAELTQRAELRTVTYRFLRTNEDALELVTATVTPWNRDAPNFGVTFQPALPDARRKFEGEFRGRFVMDVGERRNHAVGDVIARWVGQDLEIQLLSSSPWWVRNRPLISKVAKEGRINTYIDAQ